MADIIKFPKNPLAPMDVLFNEMRDQIRSLGGSERMVAWVIKDMKDRLENFGQDRIDINIPEIAAPAFQTVIETYRRIINELLLKFCILEIQLYKETVEGQPIPK